MPKGQKNVDWTKAENDQKLLLAIIHVSEISKKYDDIAAAFGMSRLSIISVQLLILGYRRWRPGQLDRPSYKQTSLQG